MNTPYLDELISTLEFEVKMYDYTKDKARLKELKAAKESLNTPQPSNSPECAMPVVGQSELCDCKTKEGHSTNKVWCYDCDKPTE